MHERLMRRCLELAGQAHGRTAPNPLVGAVIVDDNGRVIAEGYHHKRGEPHAEVHALQAAGDRARGQTIYVSLEPCCHFGRTPPCSDAVIAAGIKRVVAGMVDPNPKVAGQGLENLRRAGIEVVLVDGELERSCKWLNRGFIKRVTQQLPWTHLKMAVTLDGRIADRHGKSRWITGPEARQYVHELRNICDAVIVGGATVEADDPQLNVRDVEGGRDPKRVIIDPQLRVSPGRRIFKEGTCTVFAAEDRLAGAADLSFGETAEVIAVPGEGGRIDLRAVLQRLAQDGANEALCEGGGRLAAAFLEAHLIDEVHWFVAPMLLVDGQAVPSLAGMHETRMETPVRLCEMETKRLGEDLLIRGLLRAFN